MLQENLIHKVKNEYFREWRRRNPEKVKAIQERYWIKKAEQLKQRRAGDAVER